MSDSEQSHEMLGRRRRRQAVLREILKPVQDDRKMSVANNQVQHDRIMEQGRSMVEMLGVLAVIGVLTIIGIAGFKIAMNKAKANNLVADMNRLAHVVSMDKFSGYSADAINREVAEYNAKTEYSVTCNGAFKSAMFSLTLDDPIDKEMCEQLANLDWQVPQGVFLNEVEKSNFSAEDCTDSNKLTWVFMDDLSHCSDCVLSEVKCDNYGNECGSCSDLRGYTRDDSKCANSANGQYCVLGKCESCPPGQTYYNGCKACSTITDLQMSTSADACHQCIDDQNQPTHFLRGEPATICNRCTDLGDSVASRTTLAECNRCANRCFHPRTKQCGIPGKVGSYGADFTPYVRGNDGYCDCADGYFWRYNNSTDKLFCTTCSGLTTSSWTTVEDCHSCVNDQNQPTHFMRSSGNIHICEPCTDTQDSSAGPTSIEECRRCSNRCLKGTNCGVAGVNNKYIDLTNYKRGDDGYCVLKE